MIPISLTSFLFILIAVFSIFCNYLFLQQVDLFADKDEAFHADLSANIFQRITNGRGLADYLLDLNWPRGFHIAAAAVRIAFGPKLVFLTPTLFLILLLYGTYKIGELLKNRATGLLSAFVLALYPGIYVSSRHFDYEIPQAALVVMAVYFLMMPERFSSLRYSLSFGLLLAAGLFIKQSMVFFIAGPFLVTVYYLLKPAPQRGLRIRNLTISLAVCFLLAYLFYYRVYFFCPEALTKWGFQRLFLNNIYGVRCIRPHSFDAMLFYLSAVKDFYIGIAGLILFFIGLPHYLFRSNRQQYRLFFTAWFAVPLFILGMATLRAPHYFISCIPVFAVISAVGISYVRPVALGRSLMAVFLVLSLLSYICSTFRTWPKVRDTFMPLGLYLSWSPWGFDKERASNPTYEAAEYLDKAAGGKRSMIGIVYYLTDEKDGFWQVHCLTSLLHFASSKYKAVDLINYTDKALISECDFFVFIHSSRRSDKWLSYATFFSDIKEANRRYFRKLGFYPRYIFGNWDYLPAGKSVYLSYERIRGLNGYLPNLSLLKVVRGESNEVLVYRNDALKR